MIANVTIFVQSDAEAALNNTIAVSEVLEIQVICRWRRNTEARRT